MPTDSRTTRMTLAQARMATAQMAPPPVVGDTMVSQRAAEDPDASLATDAQLAGAVREFASGANSLRPKQLLSLRVDPGVIEAYRATGPGWQGRMHDALVAGLSQVTPRRVAERAVRWPAEARLDDLTARVTHLETQLLGRPSTAKVKRVRSTKTSRKSGR